MRFDLRKLELLVIMIHGLDLLARWSAYNLDDLHKLQTQSVCLQNNLVQP